MISGRNKININISLKNSLRLLMKNYNSAGFFQGELSSSALSTAIATFTFGIIDKDKYRKIIIKGLNWLIKNKNNDGSWGDTAESPGNISTTLLCWACFKYFENKNINNKKNIGKTEKWLINKTGSLDFIDIKKAILIVYKKDLTFSVPILTMIAIVFEKCNKDNSCWKEIPGLPYELSVLPYWLFAFLNLRIVSYAMPALISMGLIKHKKNPTKNILLRILREIIEKKIIGIVEFMQPSTGGFLEAIPLTGFVLMTLYSAGVNNKIIDRGLRFLIGSIRKDGGYPIDANINTWITTHSVNALCLSPDFNKIIEDNNKEKIIQWLLNQQYTKIHPFTKSKPGGWGWTDLNGSVPDCDDTSGVLIALYNLDNKNSDIMESARIGIKWLLSIQNNDGGFPAFCKGWGKLPFDASCPDITSHAIRALSKWVDHFSIKEKSKIINGINKGLEYLVKNQNNEGTWSPLWFGNQYNDQKQNPVYGTAVALIALNEIKNSNIKFDINNKMILKASNWLIANQNDDGGWGGKKGIQSTIEETAISLNALTFDNKNINSISRGLKWIIKETDNCKNFKPSAIGLYFASLWYHEKLYPVVFFLGALTKINKMQAYHGR